MAGDAQLIDEYRTIHATREWGGTSIKNLHYLLPHIRALKPRSIIDYGCGKSPLIFAIESPGLEKRSRYDPAIEEYATLDRGPHDLLLNVDVLEHIPEDDLDTVLAEMAAICRQAVIVVDTRPAKLTLADGRNAHVTLHDHAWWQRRIEKHFGPLQPIRVRRKGRAAFRTWKASPLERALMPFTNLRARLASLLPQSRRPDGS